MATELEIRVTAELREIRQALTQLGGDFRKVTNQANAAGAGTRTLTTGRQQSAIAGRAAYVFTGFSLPNLPPMSLGYVYLPAWLSIGVMSIVFAMLGAKLAHILPVDILKKVFAVLLIVLGIKMLFF